MYLREQTIECGPLRNSARGEDERQEWSRDLSLFRPLMLISKIKDLYHLIELANGIHQIEKKQRGSVFNPVF